jgi:DNA polymerase/3'-5' exonuclease PolX
MSDTKKRPLYQMRAVAHGLIERLAPACQRIEVAGSIRRQKPEIGDIEIVAIPKFYPDLLGEPTTISELDALLATWPIKLVKNGPKYKQFIFTGTSGEQYTIDLFLPSLETWGAIYLIRTGSADFTARMVTRQEKGGLMPDDLSVNGGRVWCNGAALATPEESDLFTLWGLDFIEPQDRR